jgi:hypothetical protein
MKPLTRWVNGTMEEDVRRGEEKEMSMIAGMKDLKISMREEAANDNAELAALRAAAPELLEALKACRRELGCAQEGLEAEG